MFGEATRNWLENQGMAQALLTGDLRHLRNYNGGELFGETDTSLLTVPFSIPPALTHTYNQHATAFGIWTSGNISRHINESFIVCRILLSYGPRWNFELRRGKFSLKFPELCVWVLVIRAEWLLCGDLLNRNIPVRSTFVPGQKTSCYPFFSTKRSCVGTKSLHCVPSSRREAE